MEQLGNVVCLQNRPMGAKETRSSGGDNCATINEAVTATVNEATNCTQPIGVVANRGNSSERLCIE